MTDPTAKTTRELAEGFASRDWVVQESFLQPERVNKLHDEALTLHRKGLFRAAGIGHGADLHVGIRGDQLLWLDSERTPSAWRVLNDELEAIRQAINAVCYLGLHEFEGHYAVYPTGAAYARHLDRFQQDNRRVMSVVLYLNELWGAEDGGELRLYPAGGQAVAVSPQSGTLVCFLSERVPHEVLATGRERFSLAGWFRQRV